MHSPLFFPAFRIALVTSALTASAALVAAAVRLLPWLLDSAVPLHVVVPFARALAAVALEAAILVGWPIGWALAAHRMVERGEALALLALGEPPSRTIARLWPQALAFAVALAVAAFVGGRDAREPGRVAGELLAQGRAACASPSVATKPVSYSVPFTGASWVCAPEGPRLVGHPPLSGGAASGALFTAKDAKIAEDFRQIELQDAWIAFGGGPSEVRVHVNDLTLRGLPTWGHTPAVPAGSRALLLSLSGVIAAALATWFSLTRLGIPRGRLHAILVGAAGPVAALGTMRVVERLQTLDHALALAVVPLASALGALAVAAVLPRLLR
jgi:hypothetical protein